ncbi:MAG: replication initiation protein [Aquabacterium sp.]
MSTDPDVLAVTATRAPEGEGAELRKPHDMIVMMPRSARVTLIGRKVYNAMLHIAQQRMALMEGMPPADFMFEAPLPVILRSTGSNGDDRTVAKKYIREMRSLEVDWESTAPGDGVKWRGFSMLSEAAIEVRGGENWVTWAYPPTIMTALKEPARWARLDLSIMARLGTYAAVALYEICARYRDNPSGLTSRKPVGWWSNALSHTPAGTEKREWRKFKNERVKAAIDEINRETDLEIELIEHKQGRGVAEVQFAVRRKHLPARPAGEDPIDVTLVIRAEALGVREAKLEELIHEFGEASVRAQLDVLERRNGGEGFPRTNRFAELRGLLRGEIGPRGTVLATSAQASLPWTAQEPATAGDPVWLEARIAQLKQEILSLDEGLRRQWAQQAVALLASRGQLNAIITRRFEQGDILHGLLGATVVQLYGEVTYGPDWNAMPGPSVGQG